MKLSDLIQAVTPLEVYGDMECAVAGVTDDSRQVRAGSVFVAVKGTRADGHAHLSQAWERGAVAAVVERPLAEIVRPDERAQLVCAHRAVVRVSDTRQALGRLAARFHGDPAHHLTMIGVTGTNGKTTVTHVIKALAERAGRMPGLLGTVGYFLATDSLRSSLTTPGAVDLQSLLATMVRRRMDTAVLEVSSHALALDRLAGCAFDLVVFTNLTQDHLDFHGTMDAYFEAKRRLFTDYVRTGSCDANLPRAIINCDDEWGRKLLGHCSVPVWTYGLQSEADIRAYDIKLGLDGTRFCVRTPRGMITVRSPLVGEYNVSNVLAGIGAGMALGLELPIMQETLETVRNVPGRFERIEEGQDFTVIVDYAHTDDALARILAAARMLGANRILTVFGCGGDRDPGKRPKMGAIAAMHSDFVILTSDNPRTEDPQKILREIELGILASPSHERAPYLVIPDRAQAIHEAIQRARPRDLVLIAGKGHEDYQILGEKRIDFDDRQVARQAIHAVGAARS
ncbi:MAG: UDP-N-acetylmuramoyl-L-alanyl-D-glutamate--2,6-diaminopimelate ligase [Nitrospirae bacterium]|nr:MAG: UDP-N-acetylmuramoyl-L-alanyl-D-glutamate--2,6-diaminopimelate ligase [Nitrospirota bacterium]